MESSKGKSYAIGNFFQDAASQVESKEELARQLTEFLLETDSLFRVQKMISCYRCALLEVEY